MNLLCMVKNIQTRRFQAAFTLVEVCLVIGLVIALTSFIGLSVIAVRDWQTGKSASLSLQAVYSAQRSFMADHPTAQIDAVSTSQLESYLPQGWSSMPVFIGLDDEALTLDHSVMPPRILNSGSIYDPSGKNNDGIWDLGK
jgi:type II secretory pathway pseudopilin PulG